MARWEPNAVGRLQEAAIDLFEQHGLDHTTVAQIARRAGLSERTFFNHFATKAEVLFGPRSEEHQRMVVRHIAAAGDAVEPLDTVIAGLQAAADELFEGLRAAASRRRRVILANPGLREREHGKRAALTAAIAETLGERGVEADMALMTARAAVLVEQRAEELWSVPEQTQPFRVLLDDALMALRAVLGAPLDRSPERTRSAGAGGARRRRGDRT